MTPKSLLRNKYCVSKIEDFNKQTSFHRILWDHALNKDSNNFMKSNNPMEAAHIFIKQVENEI